MGQNVQKNGSSFGSTPGIESLTFALVYGDVLQLIRRRPRRRSRLKVETWLPADDGAYDVGAEPSEDVTEVMMDAVLPTLEPDDESTKDVLFSAGTTRSIAAWMAA
jgi:hypothetical protein